MDALRLWILIGGAVLIAAMYFWETWRRKRAEQRRAEESLVPSRPRERDEGARPSAAENMRPPSGDRRPVASETQAPAASDDVESSKLAADAGAGRSGRVTTSGRDSVAPGPRSRVATTAGGAGAAEPFDIDEGWPVAGVTADAVHQPDPALAPEHEDPLLSDVGDARVEPTLNLSGLSEGASSASPGTRDPVRPRVTRRPTAPPTDAGGPHQLGFSELDAADPARAPEASGADEAESAAEAVSNQIQAEPALDAQPEAPAKASEPPAAKLREPEAEMPPAEQPIVQPTPAAEVEQVATQDAATDVEPEPEPDQKQISGAPEAVADDSSGFMVVLNVLAQEKRRFAGPELLTAFNAAGLVFGERSLYHRMAPGGEDVPMFSVANTVAPGVFEPDEMQELITPGVALFLEVPGTPDDIGAFDDMLATAKRLSARLDGRLCNGSREILKTEEVSRFRERIARMTQSGAS